MRFIVSFGKSNTFSLDIAPVTNGQHVSSKMSRKETVSEEDVSSAWRNPRGIHIPATLEKARSFCEGATVAFA